MKNWHWGCVLVTLAVIGLYASGYVIHTLRGEWYGPPTTTVIFLFTAVCLFMAVGAFMIEDKPNDRS